MISRDGEHRYVQPAPTIDDYWMAIYRRKWIILLIAVAAAVACGVISTKITPQFEAKAVFFVPQDAQNSLGIGEHQLGARLPTGLQDHAKAYAKLIQQNDAWAMVQGSLWPNEDTEVPADFRERIQPSVNPVKPLARFSRDIDVVPAREGTIEVYVRDHDPGTAADVANAMVAYFNAYNARITMGDLGDSVALIDEQITSKDVEIEQAIRDQGVFLAQHSIASLETKKGELERKRVRLDDQLRDAQIGVESTEDRIGALERQLEDEWHSYETGGIVVTSSILTSLQQSLASFEVDLAGKRVEFTPEHPAVRTLERQVSQTREQIALEVGRLIDNKDKPNTHLADLRRQLARLYADRASSEPRVARIQMAIATTDEAIAAIPAIITKGSLQDEALTHLQVARKELEATRNTLITRSLDMRETAVVIQAAAPPVGAAYPIVQLNIGVAAILGLIVGVIYALLLEHGTERRRIRKLRNLQYERWAESLAVEAGEAVRV
jgi:uncharacterized protein involved in exopolysaccharide biosynthesis